MLLLGSFTWSVTLPPQTCIGACSLATPAKRRRCARTCFLPGHLTAVPGAWALWTARCQAQLCEAPGQDQVAALVGPAVCASCASTWAAGPVNMLEGGQLWAEVVQCMDDVRCWTACRVWAQVCYMLLQGLHATTVVNFCGSAILSMQAAWSTREVCCLQPQLCLE